MVLERMIAHDTIQEILEALTPKQFVVAILRLEGLSQIEIAELLGVSRSVVYYRLKHAKKRLAARYPELAPVLDGREPWIGTGTVRDQAFILWDENGEETHADHRQ